MTIKEVSSKINIRINKQDSKDYDNLWPYIKKEAFNKAITDSVRRMYKGKNQTLEGVEETTGRVDDLQVLLKVDNLSVRDKGLYVQTSTLPSDYLYFSRLTPVVSKGNCSNIQIKSSLREESNVDILLPLFPSFDFEETFHTIIGNRSHVYHNKDFTIEKVVLTYYRKPKQYDFKNLDAVVEFKDDVCELFVDEACKIIASDIESLVQKAVAEQRKETND